MLWFPVRACRQDLQAELKHFKEKHMIKIAVRTLMGTLLFNDTELSTTTGSINLLDKGVISGRRLVAVQITSL